MLAVLAAVLADRSANKTHTLHSFELSDPMSNYVACDFYKNSFVHNKLTPEMGLRIVCLNLNQPRNVQPRLLRRVRVALLST